MALFVLRKPILQMRMRSHPMAAWSLLFGRTVRLLPYFMCANSEGSGVTVRMRRLTWAFAGAYVISTIISWAGSIRSFLLFFVVPEEDLIIDFGTPWRSFHCFHIIVCARSFASGINGMPMPSEGLKFTAIGTNEQWYDNGNKWLPMVFTTGSQSCRQPRAWAKLPTRQMTSFWRWQPMKRKSRW